MNNLTTLNTVFNTCKQFNVTNDMIAEILADDFPGVTGAIVSNYFTNNGFSGSELNSFETVESNFLSNKSWSIEGTTYYELGNSGLMLEKGDDYWMMGSYTLDGNTITLTDLSDNSSMNLVLDNFVVGGTMNIPSEGEFPTILSINDTMEHNGSTSWNMMGVSAREYYNYMSQLSTSEISVNFNGMKIYEGSNILYNESTPFHNEIGVAAVEDGKLYLAYEEDNSIELAVSNGTTTEWYYLGELG